MQGGFGLEGEAQAGFPFSCFTMCLGKGLQFQSCADKIKTSIAGKTGQSEKDRKE